jgi:hypothetical protein
MSVEAKYAGECAKCGIHFPVGTLITQTEYGSWYVMDCDGCECKRSGLDKHGVGPVDHIHELSNLLNPRSHWGDLSLISLTMSYEFEPHGRASETWDIIWRVNLPSVPYYWKSTKGWQRGHEEMRGMWFRGETAQQALKEALAFVRYWIKAEESEDGLLVLKEDEDENMDC